MSSDSFTIVGLAGSLRQKSYNRALLRAAQEVAPSHIHVQIFPLDGLPMFNEDLEQGGDPPEVQALKTSIAEADALLIAAPEHNYGIPAALKNALDWASRPKDGGESALFHKPVALMGASAGRFGTVRSQQAIRQVLHGTESYVLPHPEVFVLRAFEHFDANGTLSNAQTRQAVQGLLKELATWAEQVKRLK